MNLKELYLQDVEAGKINRNDYEEHVVSEKDISGLPPLIKNYFIKCGYLDKPEIINGEIVWGKVLHRAGAKKKFSKLSYNQFNSTINVSRAVYIKSLMTELLEKSVNGVGKWRIVVFKFFQLINLEDTNAMGDSALAALLAEFSFIPSFFLLDGVTFGAQTSKSIVVSFTVNKSAVSCKFHFGEDGMITRIETDDRLFSENGKGFIKAKWVGKIEGYAEKDGLRYPERFVASWATEDSEFDYFEGDVRDMVFNV